MKVLVTGANGQVGSEVCRIFESDSKKIYGYGREQLDFTNQKECQRVIQDIVPDAIIHCGAYTAVDMAESEADLAFEINAMGTRNLAVEAEKVKAKFCYISTDYVFDGKGDVPYTEYDNTNPQTVYGKSKRAGEIITQTLCSRYFIVRTSWVYGRTGKNFVKTMLNLGREQSVLKVVDDQFGSPTSASDLARFLQVLIETECYGIYHASNSGICTWHQFAEAIFKETGMTDVRVLPCKTDEFLRPAQRPQYSVLDSMAIRINNLGELGPWEESLARFLKEFKNES
ncbi:MULTISPECIES: dTDP-4-dehydrorhamnose reductase [unclassified Paenibacillus]|uniref:dTDP-4-dehydrorhamnose reductase n=1 Tax=unclassified Paenibacillus TaxID=185978 RepID=UPI00020D6F3B|nr:MULTISPECIES: dTDP-4-dehydrorhamnose reductase [unclassified Paenibacillus]EGL16399.1 dTDP-4-dehydrorhamnose reductase [Paenibacillus sp. HGF7]EPD83861.1 dTDP-4-dehydrorhamnose reductase [Paenibacillus sp. HGH0039]